VQRIERDDGAGGNAEFRQQRLRRRDLVGLLCDVDMGEHEGGVGGERAQHLRRGAVVEVVEAATQRLAIQCDRARSGCCTCGLQQGRVATEHRLHIDRIEPLEDVADGGMCRCAAPFQAEHGVQPVAMHVDEGDDAAIRVAAGHDGQDGKQQHMGKLVDLPLSTTRVRDFGQQAQQRRKCNHGNLRRGCRPRSQTFADSRIPFLIRASGGRWCSPDSDQATHTALNSLGSPMDMMRQGCSMSLFQASQQ
jgi:hypothetical protein